MNGFIDWLADQATTLAYWTGLLAIGVYAWHRTSDNDRDKSRPVRDWLDDAKARQYGQPTVYPEVLDHYDPRNDVEVSL